MVLCAEAWFGLLGLFVCFFCSNDNLCKDMYLRRHMDEQGWVPVALIAGFNRVSV